MLAEIERLGREGVALDELDTMRAGLKSSLIMAQESSMSRSGSLATDWYFLGQGPPDRRNRRRARRTDRQNRYPSMPAGCGSRAT